MAYYDHNEKFLWSTDDLTLIGKGTWSGDFNNLHAVLMQFSERNIGKEFGHYSCRFQIMTTDDRKLLTTRDGNEALWFAGTSWTPNCGVPLIEVIKEGETRYYYPPSPGGKVLAIKIARGVRVELWHYADNIEATASENYFSLLLQALVDDGLQLTDKAAMTGFLVTLSGIEGSLVKPIEDLTIADAFEHEEEVVFPIPGVQFGLNHPTYGTADYVAYIRRKGRLNPGYEYLERDMTRDALSSAYSVSDAKDAKDTAVTNPPNTPQEIQTNTRAIIKRDEFLNQLDAVFNMDDLRELCFNMSVDFDNLAGNTKRQQFITLIQEFERENRLNDLIQYCKQERPQRDWEGFVHS